MGLKMLFKKKGRHPNERNAGIKRYIKSKIRMKLMYRLRIS